MPEIDAARPTRSTRRARRRAGRRSPRRSGATLRARNGAGDEILGHYDLVSLKAVVTEVNIAGQLGIRLHHSGDGLSYPAKNASDEILGALSTDTVNVLWGADSSGQPSLHLVRAHIGLSSGTTQAYLRLYATLRDRGKGRAAGRRKHRNDERRT